MLAFSCPHCGVRLRVEDRWAGRPVQCGGCRGVAQAPGGADEAERKSTLPPAANGAAAVPPDVPPELYDFLSPPQGPGEIGRLGSYRVLKVLGSGGMGVVFLAEDTRLQRPVALKSLLPSVAANPVSRERFLREARASASIEHDNVIALFAVGEERGIPFLAMPLLEGESLEDRLRREGRLPVPDVLRVGREAAEGLAAAHARGVIHRDVKPTNLWLEAARGRVKIFDFGLACPVEGGGHLTTPGALLGSPGYMAPEQVAGGRVDPRTDLFSLGCVLYRCCTGELPFKGADIVSTLAAVATETARPVRERNPEVPPGLAHLIERMLSKDPAGRPPSARAVADALAALESGEPELSLSSASRAAPAVPAAVPADRRHALSGALVARHLPAVIEEDDEPPPPLSDADDRTLPLIATAKRPPASGPPRWMVPVFVGCFLLLGLVGTVLTGLGAWWYWGGDAPPAEKASTTTPKDDAKKGDAKKGGEERWTVLFRADDPRLWDTDSPGKNFAVPVRQAPKETSHLRLRRMDTGEALIVPITRDRLRAANQPAGAGGYSWNGSAKEEWGARHLGIAQGPRHPFPIPNHMITVLNAGWDGWTGSGFGHQAFNDNTGQYYAWRGKQIDKTAFEIAVTDKPLTDDEKHSLLAP